MKLKLVLAWYNLWIGVFIDREKGIIYIFPVPMIGLRVHLVPDGYRLVKRISGDQSVWYQLHTPTGGLAKAYVTGRTWWTCRAAAWRHYRTPSKPF